MLLPPSSVGGSDLQASLVGPFAAKPVRKEVGPVPCHSPPCPAHAAAQSSGAQCARGRGSHWSPSAPPPRSAPRACGHRRAMGARLHTPQVPCPRPSSPNTTITHSRPAALKSARGHASCEKPRGQRQGRCQDSAPTSWAAWPRRGRGQEGELAGDGPGLGGEDESREKGGSGVGPGRQVGVTAGKELTGAGI